MDPPPARHPAPFVLTLGVAVLVSVVVALLPETAVTTLRDHRPLGDSAAWWAFRLILLAAIGQALYVGFALLHPERIKAARIKEARLARMTRDELLRSITRHAATIATLTLVYGLSAFLITGERDAYWLFPFLLIAQVAIYYRQVGGIESWLSFQPEFVTDTNDWREPSGRDGTGDGNGRESTGD
ncbi:MAG: hypothetical protein ACR2L3_06395 [Actinomycetota bacterium]